MPEVKGITSLGMKLVLLKKQGKRDEIEEGEIQEGSVDVACRGRNRALHSRVCAERAESVPLLCDWSVCTVCGAWCVDCESLPENLCDRV